MKKVIIIGVFAAVICMILFFYPKQMVIGGLKGYVPGPDFSVYREEYQCFGFSAEVCDEQFVHTICSDVCYGITHSKSCFNETFFDKTQIECR